VGVGVGNGKNKKNKKTKTVGCLGPGNATATLTMERNEIDLVSLLRGSDVAAVVEANCACVGAVSAREGGRASLSLSLSPSSLRDSFLAQREAGERRADTALSPASAPVPCPVSTYCSRQG